MKFLKRMFGVCETKQPADPDCWRYEAGRLEVDLLHAPELADKGGALRFEGDVLPKRVLVVHGADDEFRAYHNKCTHVGRRIDVLDAGELLECCSVSKSGYALTGQNLRGPGRDALALFPTTMAESKLFVELEE